MFEDLDVDKLMTFAQEAIGVMRGRYFGWKVVWDSNSNWFAFSPSLWNSHNEIQLMLPSSCFRCTNETYFHYSTKNIQKAVSQYLSKI